MSQKSYLLDTTIPEIQNKSGNNSHNSFSRTCFIQTPESCSLDKLDHAQLEETMDSHSNLQCCSLNKVIGEQSNNQE